MRRLFMIIFFVLTGSAFARQALAESGRVLRPDPGPCASKTNRPGFIVAAKHTPKLYLDLDQGMENPFYLGDSERRAVYRFSIIRSMAIFTNGCSMGAYSCIRDAQIDPATAIATLTIEPRCEYGSPEAGEGFKVLPDQSIVLSGENDLCLGISSDGKSVITDQCSKVPATSRLYWVLWE